LIFRLSNEALYITHHNGTILVHANDVYC